MRVPTSRATWRVRVPKGWRERSCGARRRRSIHAHARNPARNVTIGGRATVFAPAYGPPFVSDTERRPPLRHARGLPELREARLPVSLAASLGRHRVRADGRPRQQAPPRHAVRAHDALGQAFMGSVTTAARAADSIEMCRVLFGAEFVDRHCVILGNVNVNSPLVLDGEASRVIRTYAAANQAPVCVPFILGGAMGPVTTAGGLAQCFAEALFCVALGQLERPGSPVILGNFLSSMSLKQRRAYIRHAGASARLLCNRTAGAPPRRAAAVRRQSVRLQGPRRARRLRERQLALARTSSPVRTSCCTRPAGSKAGLVMSYEKFVMDLDQCGAFHVVAAGWSSMRTTLRWMPFARWARASISWARAHTMRNYETAFFDVELSDNNSFEQWTAGRRARHRLAGPPQVAAQCSQPTSRRLDAGHGRGAAGLHRRSQGIDAGHGVLASDRRV